APPTPQRPTDNITATTPQRRTIHGASGELGRSLLPGRCSIMSPPSANCGLYLWSLFLHRLIGRAKVSLTLCQFSVESFQHLDAHRLYRSTDRQPPRLSNRITSILQRQKG